MANTQRAMVIRSQFPALLVLFLRLGPVFGGQVAETFQPGKTAVSASVDQSLLEIAESNNQPIEAGCRIGMCGADPVTIVEGMENLSPMGDDERATLERMGLGQNVRDAGEGELVLEDPPNQRYRKLVIADGKIVGAILLGYAREATAVTAAIKQAWDVTDMLPALLAGRWEVLGQRMAQPTAV